MHLTALRIHLVRESRTGTKEAESKSARALECFLSLLSCVIRRILIISYWRFICHLCTRLQLTPAHLISITLSELRPTPHERRSLSSRLHPINMSRTLAVAPLSKRALGLVANAPPQKLSVFETLHFIFVVVLPRKLPLFSCGRVTD